MTEKTASHLGQASVPAAVELDRAVVDFRPRRTLASRGGRPIRALDGVSIRAVKGRTVGVVGESGSGKSTMAKTMLRIHRPTEGRVLMGGEDITGLPEKAIRPLRRHVQMVFQDPFSSLNPRQTVKKILAEPLRVHNLAEQGDADDRVFGVLNSVGLPNEAADRYPHEFSGGQRQRIAIARALMSEPEVVICDEPVSALDVSVQAQVLRLLSQIQAETGVGYVFIAHDLAVVAAMAHEVHVMYGGVVVETGPTRDVLTNPQHPYTAGLVASIPSVRLADPTFAASRDIRGEPRDPSAEHTGCRFAPRCWLRTELGSPEICTTHDPVLRSATEGRQVACHFPTVAETPDGAGALGADQPIS